VYADQWDERVCMPPDEPIPCLTNRSCPEPLVCGPTATCTQQCRTDRDCALYVPGATCIAGAGDAGSGGTCSFHPALADSGSGG